nr:MerR family DNA-binding transcriptional regulator [Pseudacidovorax sp.]
MPTHAFTIRKLADAAGVGVEAVRYYQRGGLLAAPDRVDGGFRQFGGRCPSSALHQAGSGIGVLAGGHRRTDVLEYQA